MADLLTVSFWQRAVGDIARFAVDDVAEHGIKVPAVADARYREDLLRLACASAIRFEYYKTRALSNDRPAPYSIDALRDGEIDLAIDTCAFNENPPRGLDCVKICDEPITVIASSRNPLAQSGGLRIEDLFANTLVVFAVQQHCPKVLLAPFLAAGYSPRRTKTVFVDNLLEIPEQLANLAADEVVPMQQYYCQAFGFDQDGLGNVLSLDLKDERAFVFLVRVQKARRQRSGACSSSAARRHSQRLQIERSLKPVEQRRRTLVICVLHLLAHLRSITSQKGMPPLVPLLFAATQQASDLRIR